MNRKVLNRPMFARMRDGSIKPVQYAQVGLLIQGGSKLLPYVPRGLQAIKNTLFAVISGGRNLITKGKNLIKTSPKKVGTTGTDQSFPISTVLPARTHYALGS